MTQYRGNTLLTEIAGHRFSHFLNFMSFSNFKLRNLAS